MPAPASTTPILTPIADSLASILRVPGQILREAAIAIDVNVAKGIFIAYFLLLILWVLSLRKEEVTVTNERKGTSVSLRPYAILALLSQVVIYLVF